MQAHQAKSVLGQLPWQVGITTKVGDLEKKVKTNSDNNKRAQSQPLFATDSSFVAVVTGSTVLGSVDYSPLRTDAWRAAFKVRRTPLSVLTARSVMAWWWCSGG